MKGARHLTPVYSAYCSVQSVEMKTALGSSKNVFSCGNLNNILIKQQKNYSLCQSFVIKQATGNCFPSPYYYY